MRSTDLIARLGGDEFVIVLDDTGSPETVMQIVDRILADCQIPLQLKEHEIFAGLSIGIVLGHATYQQAADLIRDADIAMYRAKSETGNAYRFFDAAMHAQAMRRMHLETDLRKALEQDEFVLYYQPVFDLHHKHLVGFEALVRWQHPTCGLMMPGEFISAAEEMGLIVRLDQWVLRTTCHQIAQWQKLFPACFPLKVSVNLSAQDLRQPQLIETIDHILQETGLQGEAIALEMTESMLIENSEQTQELFTQLQARGIYLSIDDFGTGYSSLSYLHRLPAHYLKIDRSFVSQMEVSDRDYQIVRTIMSLSKQLGLVAIAEGIETEEQLRQLKQLGCELGQCYLFSPPLPVPEVEARFFRASQPEC